MFASNAFVMSLGDDMIFCVDVLSAPHAIMGWDGLGASLMLL